MKSYEYEIVTLYSHPITTPKLHTVSDGRIVRLLSKHVDTISAALGNIEILDN